jgi:DNA adenine methylase
MTEPTRPVLRYFGGKWLLAPWIIERFPPHKVYVEPFGGAASVLMRKARSYAEVYNDLDGEIVNLFQVLRCHAKAERLERLLCLTPFSRAEFEFAYRPSAIPVERARRLIIRSYMGFGSDGHNLELGVTGFRANSNKSGTTPAHDWANFPDQIKAFTERLAGVVIENRDACEVMAQQDSLETLHFVDPPYVQSTRGRHKHRYRFEMSDADHVKLCGFLKSLKGMVILCGYENQFYESLGWAREARETFADGAKRRKEIIWLNSAAYEKQEQHSFNLEGA